MITKNSLPEEMQETIRFAEKLNPTYVSFHVISPHEAINPQQRVGSEDVLAFPQNAASFNPALRKQVRQALRKFYLKPSYLFSRFRHLSQGNWPMLLAQARLFQGYLMS